MTSNKIRKLRKEGKLDVSKIKRNIQKLLREIVILRDGGCFLRFYPKAGACDSKNVLQADHLITRQRNISFADSRLVVCVCRRHHIFWKKQHPDEYMRYARDFIGKEREGLLNLVESDGKTYRFYASDWILTQKALEKELEKLLEKLKVKKQKRIK